MGENIDVPTFEFVKTQGELACADTQYTLSATNVESGFDVVWSSANSSAVPADGMTIYTTEVEDTYTVTVTDPSNGCSDTKTQIVTQNTSTIDVSIADPAQLLCG